MRSKNLICAILGFLTLLLAAYFGASIYNAQATHLIQHLEEIENIQHYAIDLVPYLNYQAAVFTLPFLLITFFLEIYIRLKSQIKQVKNIALGLIVALFIVIVIAILTLLNPTQYDFSKWGYVWLTISILVVAGNLISVFVKGNKPR
jgi:phosphoglycerol transferase MdoB-like AlkP superfamily enzyme